MSRCNTSDQAICRSCQRAFGLRSTSATGSTDGRERPATWLAGLSPRSEWVCSLLNVSGRADVILRRSHNTFEPMGATLVFLRHHPQPLRGDRMRSLARNASTKGGMIQ